MNAIARVGLLETVIVGSPRRLYFGRFGSEFKRDVSTEQTA
jgi:hypothetical protein